MLSVTYFYSLTYREFQNTVNGFRKYEDAKSREQWVMTRKVMWSALRPYQTESFKETDVQEFPWEKDLINKISEKEYQEMLEVERISKAFFDKYDSKKLGNKPQA
ncbi:hypothetical protein [Flavobacterium sp. WC2509]|uniref:hypothetical protein n=1 Tax=Flavobacterium sp. WC2509 TaxID=3461406 RepID=UPI0040441316